MAKKINSRAKGAGGERELAKELRTYGYETRRGQQYSGANGDPDVVGLPGIHIECKRYEKMYPGNLANAVWQAKRDARDDERPVVMYREDYKKWQVRISVSDLSALVGEMKDDIDPDLLQADLPLQDFMEIYMATRHTCGDCRHQRDDICSAGSLLKDVDIMNPACERFEKCFHLPLEELEGCGNCKNGVGIGIVRCGKTGMKRSGTDRCSDYERR